MMKDLTPKLTETERAYLIGWLNGVLEYLGFSMTAKRILPQSFRKSVIDGVLESIAQGSVSQKEYNELMGNVKIHLLLAQAISTGTLDKVMKNKRVSE